MRTWAQIPRIHVKNWVWLECLWPQHCGGQTKEDWRSLLNANLVPGLTREFSTKYGGGEGAGHLMFYSSLCTHTTTHTHARARTYAHTHTTRTHTHTDTTRTHTHTYTHNPPTHTHAHSESRPNYMEMAWMPEPSISWGTASKSLKRWNLKRIRYPS